MTVAPLEEVPAGMAPVVAHTVAVGTGMADRLLDKSLVEAGIPARMVDRAAGILPRGVGAAGLPLCLHSYCPRWTPLT